MANDNAENPNPQSRTRALARIGALVLVLAVLAGAGYLIFRNRNTPTDEPSNTADEIRNAFNNPVPPTNTVTSTPVFTPPVQTPPTSTPPRDIPARQVRPPQPTPFVYASNPFGISVTLPPAWMVDQSNSSGQRIVFTGPATHDFAYVEMYDNVQNVTLDSLADMFSRTPQIYSVKRVSVGGESGIMYLSTNRSQSGIAIIRQNRLYYLHGKFIESEFLNNFKFI